MAPTTPGSAAGAGRLGSQTDPAPPEEPTSERGRNYELSLPDTPPSLNAVGSRGKSPWRFVNEKKKWEGLLGIGLMEAKVPRKLERVKATAVLTFPDKRKRDEGNFRVMLEKALGDILTKGGWLIDDDADRYSFGGLEFAEERGDRQTLVRLEVQP